MSAEFGFDRKSIIASPAVVGGTVYAGSRDGLMYAFDQETGERRWRAAHRVSWAMSSPAVRDGVLYSGTSDRRFVHALEVDSGEEIWRFVARGYTWSSPALVGRTLYIGAGGGQAWHLRLCRCRPCRRPAAGRADRRRMGAQMHRRFSSHHLGA